MSGMASAASTIPGSVATLRSCSSDLSAAIAARISSSAKTRAGTRISPSAGISQSVSSSRRRSDNEPRLRAPALAGRLELEAMVGDRLHERPRLGDPAAHGRFELRTAKLEVGAFRYEGRRVGEEEAILER